MRSFPSPCPCRRLYPFLVRVCCGIPPAAPRVRFASILVWSCSSAIHSSNAWVRFAVSPLHTPPVRLRLRFRIRHPRALRYGFAQRSFRSVTLALFAVSPSFLSAGLFRLPCLSTHGAPQFCLPFCPSLAHMVYCDFVPLPSSGCVSAVHATAYPFVTFPPHKVACNPPRPFALASAPPRAFSPLRSLPPLRLHLSLLPPPTTVTNFLSAAPPCFVGQQLALPPV